MDGVLIYGDTNSTLAGALCAAKLHIPIAHVEAGLRSYNRKMPEEINRIVADQLSQLLFAPTRQSVNNLKKEGHKLTSIKLVGDIMYDAAIFFGHKAQKHSQILDIWQLQEKNYILATIHRAENTDDIQKLKNIFTALLIINKVMPLIVSIHPRTKKNLQQHCPEVLQSNLNLIDPIGFLDMLMLEKNAALIITDSGGVQKEAFFHQIPCVTLRSETEWVETVDLDWNFLVNPNEADAIVQQSLARLNHTGKMNIHPYGKGNACQLIVQHLQHLSA